VTRGDPVDGIRVVGDADTVAGQLVTESYRPRTGHRRRRPQLVEALGQLLGPADERLPEPLSGPRVQRREDLAAEAVENRQPLPLRPGLGADPAGERVEGADAGRRQPGRRRQPARGRDPDPQPGERAGPESDRDQVDRLPTAGSGGGTLDLAEQRRRVPGPAGGREPQLRLVQDLAVAPGAGGGVDGRGVEADDDQRGSAPQPRTLCLSA